MRKPYPSIRIFKSDFIEWFSHVHPAVPICIWGPFVAVLLYRSIFIHSLEVSTIAAIGFAGLFFWSFIEYVLHRFIFHFNAQTPFEKRVQFLIHGLHHADPVDPTRLVMPPAAAIFLAVTLGTVFRAVLGSLYFEPFFAGFVVGYLCYDYIHFAIHHFKPKSKLARAIKQHHMRHHFASSNARWGVSSPLWDHVFGTQTETERRVPEGRRA